MGILSSIIGVLLVIYLALRIVRMLNRKIRGQTYEGYRRIARKQIDLVGQHNFERLSPAEMSAVNNSVMAEAYVTEWNGAIYPNGGAMPFSTSNLAILMDKDEYLGAFISDEAKRISPPWPQR
jgi:hypothetical protein